MELNNRTPVIELHGKNKTRRESQKWLQNMGEIKLNAGFFWTEIEKSRNYIEVKHLRVLNKISFTVLPSNTTTRRR